MSPTARHPARGARPPRVRPAPPSPFRLQMIGVLVLVVLALAVYAVFVRSVPWSSPWTLRAVFANSAQIVPGSPVRIAGLDVGDVASVTQGPGTTALVTMDVNADGRPIHADATAEIRPRLFLEGSYYVDLHPGAPGTPTVDSGHTIPLPQTSIPVSFSTVLSTLTAPVRNSLVSIIHTLARGLGRGGAHSLNRDLTTLSPAFASTALASEALIGTGPADVAGLIEGADRVTTALASQASALSHGIDAESALASTLAANDEQLTASIGGIDSTLAVAPVALQAVTKTLPALTDFADRLDPSLQAAPAVLGSLQGLLAQVRQLVAHPELPELTATLGPLSSDLNQLEPKLDDLLPRVKQVSSCAGHQLVNLLDTKLKDGKLSTGQTVWQELAHVNVGLAAANEDFDAAGTRVRFATNIQPDLLGLGSVPGAGELIENTEEPILAARPLWNGPTPPPVHPEVACTSQKLGDLQAASVPVPGPQAVQLNMSAVDRLLTKEIKRARRKWRR